MTRPERRLRLVLDTNVLVAAMRSPTGASSALLGYLEEDAFQAVVNTALVLEYEAVLVRSELRVGLDTTIEEILSRLDLIVARTDQAMTRFSWRPQLADAADEMVLEAAVNGRADAIVTFNTRHLAPAIGFGVEVMTPSQAVKRLRHGKG